MELKKLLQDIKTEPIEEKQYSTELTNEMPVSIPLNTLDDLIKICELYGLPVPTHAMFERESQIEELIGFLRNLKGKLSEIDLILPDFEMNDQDIQEIKQKEEKFDRIEIEMAHMEKDYEMLNEFRHEILKFHNKDTTTDFISTSTTYDVKKDHMSNVFVDKNIPFAEEKTTTQPLDDNMILSFLNSYETKYKDLKNSPYLKYRQILLNLPYRCFFFNVSYRSYKNLKRKQMFLNKIVNMPDSFCKSFFIELISKRTLSIDDIKTRYGIDHMVIFKLVYHLEIKKILFHDKANGRVRIYCD